ncbi:MAG: type II toxin-antitoxin system prevent-host-death family antitoxin [Actinomycetota bacterium]|nr:type II toxin-antitoxin system prevent-host-death family antitoxin [Actinomycetota bacterium]
MSEINVRELRNHGGEVLDRVARGETLTVTRAGVPVAELRPLARPPVTARTLLARWRRVPEVDPAALREDLDQLLEPSL